MLLHSLEFPFSPSPFFFPSRTKTGSLNVTPLAHCLIFMTMVATPPRYPEYLVCFYSVTVKNSPSPPLMMPKCLLPVAWPPRGSPCPFVVGERDYGVGLPLVGLSWSYPMETTPGLLSLKWAGVLSKDDNVLFVCAYRTSSPTSTDCLLLLLLSPSSRVTDSGRVSEFLSIFVSVILPLWHAPCTFLFSLR